MRRRMMPAALLATAIGMSVAGSVHAQDASPEPTADIACSWWPDLRSIWTPVGWKNHLFRFNVFYNGMIVAQPDLNRRTEPWKGQGVQLTFVPIAGDACPSPTFVTRDDGSVRQGWREDHAAPVLWSEWPADGLLLREETFGHVPGGRDIETGTEPLFAWVRLSVHYVCPALPVPPRHGFAVKVNGPHVHGGMTTWNNLTFYADRVAYPRKLAAEPDAPLPAEAPAPPDAPPRGRKGPPLPVKPPLAIPDGGWRLLEEDGKVRLGLAPGAKATVAFYAGRPTERDSYFYVQMDAKEGEHVDLLVPMLPTERAVFDAELALGRDQALAEADAYWSKVPATAARVDTPEPLVNDVIRHGLKFGEVIAERDPATGITTMLSGSLTYANGLWATPGSMNLIMLLDTMGCHAVVDRYIEMFRAQQGTVKPPGDAFPMHPGYLSSPKTLTSVDWVTDHGAILYTLAEHALLSGDADAVARWTGPIVKGCEFIRDARAITDHPGLPGILPPAVATDNGTRIQSVWSDGWNYKGLCAAVRLLKKINHPRAAEFEAEAKAYREAFLKNVRAKCATMPRWTDAAGKEHPFVPTSLYGDKPVETIGAFYLDAGPLHLVYSGLVDADDPLMRSTLSWFREGPQTRMFRRESSCWQVPMLVHEMSSCEPCYSWNVFHPWQTGDRAKFLEGMYSLFAGSISRQTFISCETRYGVTGNNFAAPLGVYCARLAVIDDQIRDGELHLLRLVPKAWLRQDRETVFGNMPTEYGPVTLRFKLADGGKTLAVAWEPKFRQTPGRVELHVPPVEGLTQVTVNGKAVAWDGKAGGVELW